MLKACAQQFPVIEATFAEASRVLGNDLWAMAQAGPPEALNSTVNTQPILLAAGVALWRVWQQNQGALPWILAGHSLGEYTALVCAGALDFEEAIALVAKRGAYMQEAVPEGVGAMAAILGMENVALEAICQAAAQGEVVSPANFNAIGQTVIAGNVDAVSRVVQLVKAEGKKAILLPVSVPSHCALMHTAAEKLRETLTSVRINPPTYPIIHNVHVDTCAHPDDIRACLVQQLSSPVRWVETMQRFVQEGITSVVECGPGKVLSGLIKRIDPTLQAISIEEQPFLATTGTL